MVANEIVKMPYKRPTNVPMGQVWRRFVGRERDGMPARTYQIRDMVDEHKEKCLNLMMETFLRDEPLVKALDLNRDQDSMETLKANWLELMEQKLSIACYTEVDGEPDKLVGFNVLFVKCKDDPEDDFDKIKGEPWKQILKTLIHVENLENVFEKYNVDKYLRSKGMAVLREHRGQNIGAEMFAARESLCKSLGIRATAIVLTAITSQVLAKKCGYELLGELEYKDMMKYGIDLSRSHTLTGKLMGTKFNF